MTSSPTPAPAIAAGSLNRVVRTKVREGAARAMVEDDFHHFRLTLRHRGGKVESVEAEGLRFPYSLCPEAGGRLQELVGVPLTPLAAEVFRFTEPRLQCTHQFDLAALAIAAAARGHGRRYRVAVPDPVEERTRAALYRDEAEAMSWHVEGYSIAGPERFAGIGLGAGFTDWVTKNLAPDEAEAALVLRRGVFISRGRAMLARLDTRAHAPASGGCWVHQPGRAETARRERNSWRDFSGRAELLGASDEAWLGFADMV